MAEYEYHEPRFTTTSERRLPSRSKERFSEIPQKSLDRKEYQPETNFLLGFNKKDHLNPRFSSYLPKQEQYGSFGSLQTNFMIPTKPSSFTYQLEEQIQSRRTETEELKNTVALLESSLKSEISRREEQHEYISMLKQALTTKLYDSGLLSFLSSVKGNLQDNEINLYLELSKLQNVVDQHKQDKIIAENKTSQLYQQLEKAKFENEQLNASLKEQSRVIEKTNENLDKLLVTISSFEEENKNLLTEKDSLLDYMEDLSKQLERSKQENREIQVELEVKQNQIQELRGKYRDGSPKPSDPDPRLRKLMRELKEITELSVTMEGKLKTLATENAKVTKDYASLQGKYEIVLKEKEELEKRSEVKKTEREVINRELIEKVHIEVPKLMRTAEKNELNNKSRLLDGGKSSNQLIPEKDIGETNGSQSQPEISKFEISHQETPSIAIMNEAKNLKGIIEDYKVKLEREQSAKVEETRVLYERLSDLKNEIKKLSEEKAVIKEQKINLEEQLRDVKDKLKAQETNLNQQLQENLRLSTAIGECDRESPKFNDGVSNSGIESLVNQIDELNEKFSALQKEYQAIQQSRENSLSELEARNETIENLKKQLIETEAVIANKQSDKETISKQLQDMKHYFIELAKYIEPTSGEPKDFKMFQSGFAEDQIILHLQEKLNAFFNERAESKSHLAEVQAKSDCMTQEKLRLEQEFGIACDKQAGLENEVQRLNDQLADYRQQLMQQEQSKAKNEGQENIVLRKQIIELKARCGHLEFEKQGLHFVIEKLREASINQDSVTLSGETSNHSIEPTVLKERGKQEFMTANQQHKEPEKLNLQLKTQPNVLAKENKLQQLGTAHLENISDTRNSRLPLEDRSNSPFASSVETTRI